MSRHAILKLGFAEVTDSPGGPGVPGGIIMGQTVLFASETDLTEHVALPNPHGTSSDHLLPPTQPVRLPVFTTAGRPLASAWTAGVIFVSDASAGQKVQVSDGSTWIAIG